MNKYIYFLALSVLFFSCEEEEFRGEFDSVTLYYYGRSHSGLTYEVPLKFYSNGKETAFFVLYSLSPNLENGTYNYNDLLHFNCQTFRDFAFTNNTFYKNVCKWNNNVIIDGTVTVEKSNDNYTFLIDVTYIKGENHKGTFKGKVKKENYHKQSNVNGVFASASIDNCVNDRVFGLPEDYSGGLTWLTVSSGDILLGMTVNIICLRPSPNDFTGVYEVNPNANGRYSPDGSAIQNGYDKKGTLGVQNEYKLISGTFIVTRVDKPWRFKIDVDVVAENGDIIQGSFDGGEIWFSGYDYQNYADYNYADYYK